MAEFTPVDRIAGRTQFPPIADYAFISDCHTGALIAPNGAVEWLCVPHFDSPSIFSALLDRGAGAFRLGPYGTYVPVGRRYEPGTNIVETTWVTKTGWIVVRDALTFGPWHNRQDSVHTRPPTDHDAEHVLVRTVECTQGSVEVELVCAPIFQYGAVEAQWSICPGQDAIADATDGETTVRLASSMRLGVEGNRIRARHSLSEGEVCYAALSWAPDLAVPQDVAVAQQQIDLTRHYWRNWLANGEFPDHPWRTYLQRSALVLKGLTYAPTGAAVAAPTTSLPETPGGERNWDYRYTWLRDATFMLYSLHALGMDWEADDFMQFVADVECNKDGSLQIMYGPRGDKDLTEYTLDHLKGYENARPVRVGNAAYKQKQNDVYGAVLDSVYIHSKVRDYLPERLWPVLKNQAECTMRVWREPDRGIWEVRGKPRHYVSSKLMCWVALDRAARLAELRGDLDLAERWQSEADCVRADILERAVSDRGVFRQHYDTDALDASNLLIPMVRFLPGTDERVRNTVLAIANELTVHGLVMRYKVNETDDGLQGEEGSFAICSFWLVSALSEIGEVERAATLCERLLSFASPLDLYGEEIDPRSGRHLGNFPQAFTHLGLINAVLHVIADEKSARNSTPDIRLRPMGSKHSRT